MTSLELTVLKKRRFTIRKRAIETEVSDTAMDNILNCQLWSMQMWEKISEVIVVGNENCDVLEECAKSEEILLFCRVSKSPCLDVLGWGWGRVYPPEFV
ncbi:hypothetical protein RJ641_008116 [Dillenia turbinata]|uniref:Uncharacterized protein n=1 Tax=Dillenia turbinata TaxID=194707 RepID=A0AAN8VF81_9MAGN